jgi:hypothetical protein
MKKQSFYFFLLLLIVLVGFNSCTIKKRLYQPGYQVEWHKINKETKPNPSNEALASNDMDNKDESVFENQEIIADESNQTEIIQEDEPVYASNDENANNIEIINSTKHKNTFTTNSKKVTFEIYKSGIRERTIKSPVLNKQEKEIHNAAIIGIVFCILGYGMVAIISLGPSLGFLVLCMLLSAAFMLLGFIFSYLALSEIKSNPMEYRGSILAKVGLAMCFIYVILPLIGLIL